MPHADPLHYAFGNEAEKEQSAMSQQAAHDAGKNGVDTGKSDEQHDALGGLQFNSGVNQLSAAHDTPKLHDAPLSSDLSGFKSPGDPLLQAQHALTPLTPPHLPMMHPHNLTPPSFATPAQMAMAGLTAAMQTPLTFAGSYDSSFSLSTPMLPSVDQSMQLESPLNRSAASSAASTPRTAATPTKRKSASGAGSAAGSGATMSGAEDSAGKRARGMSAEEISTPGTFRLEAAAARLPQPMTGGAPTAPATQHPSARRRLPFAPPFNGQAAAFDPMNLLGGGVPGLPTSLAATTAPRSQALMPQAAAAAAAAAAASPRRQQVPLSPSFLPAGFPPLITPGILSPRGAQSSLTGISGGAAGAFSFQQPFNIMCPNCHRSMEGMGVGGCCSQECAQQFYTR